MSDKTPAIITPELCFASDDGVNQFITIKKGETLLKVALTHNQKMNILEILIRSMQ